MAFRLDDFQKNTRFPEEGTPEFMVAMGNSLKAYDAALGLLIDVMELLRDSFMEVVEIHYGISAYEEFLKDNRAAEKAKEMRPETVEREGISEEDQKEDQRVLRETKPDQDQPGKAEGQQGQAALRNPENQGWEDPKEKKDAQDMMQDPEGYWEEEADQLYDPDLVQELEDISQQEEKRRGR